MCAVVFACVSPAQAGRFLPHPHGMTLEAKVRYFQRSIRHERQTVRWLESRAAPRTLERHSELRWHRAALAWSKRLLVRYSAKLLPSPRAYAGPCLAAIIDHEGSGWNPRKWNGGTIATAYIGGPIYGSGAYGLPQALPASKMASAGSDWATNVYTQILWLKGYVSRYGGDCAALAWWNSHGSY